MSHCKFKVKRGQMSICQNKRKFILPFLIIGVFAILTAMTCFKVHDIAHWPTYSKEHILRNVRQVKNRPLVEELVALHDSVGEAIHQKSGAVEDIQKRANLILLTKICKDSCKAIRCRVDPGLGQACRQNCPQGKTNFCILATKRLPDERGTK